MNNFSIKVADLSHVLGIAEVLKRSIKELCVSDHKNNPSKLEDWLINKTPENVSKWINNPSNHILVALNNKIEIIGVSAINNEGEILLNYLLPEFLSKGIGKCMLYEMELFAKKSGITRIIALSTLTALDFYKRNGFKEISPGKDNEKVKGIRLIKVLTD